ncbi:MAG: hypothetical protein Q4A92_11670 [Corynebacterium sp.]|nr:hypothetical protein [Corynebacterium sp.]
MQEQETSLGFLTRDAERMFATELAEHQAAATAITDQWLAKPPAGFRLSTIDWSAATVEELYRLLLESDDAEFAQHVAMFLGEGLVRLCGWNWTIAWVPPEYPGMIMYEFGVAPPDLQQISFPLSWVHTAKDIRKGHSLGSISNIVDTIEQHRKHDPS